ncbi:SDA1-domain-containing protein [Ramicandelaber brevisporus]|nr:SDA1-domain-containing protein [Ramicandelaber brevisporus]
MAKKRVAATEKIHDLPSLQNKIKRDSLSYRDEFLQQWKHYLELLEIFKLRPDDESSKFAEQLAFIAQVAPVYPNDTKEFPNHLIDLLSKHHSVLDSVLRKAMVQSLMLLRNRDVISNHRTLPLFFTLFRCPDRELRDLLYGHIVNDIRVTNHKHKNNKLNRELQGFMFNIILDLAGDSAIAAKKSLEVCIELYRKNVWNDAKTVNIIAQACLSPVTKVMSTAAHFFTSSAADRGNNKGSDNEDDESEDEMWTTGSRMTQADLARLGRAKTVTKKTKSRQRKYEKAVAKLNSKGKGNKGNTGNGNFSAIALLNDPQGFVEKLFARRRTVNAASNEKFEIKLVLLRLIARVIGHHQLHLPSLYPFLMRYLQPHQRDVTQILALTATACHSLVPPEDISVLLMHLANNFVTDRCAPEVMAAGLNAIREISARCPLAMSEDLLHDLTTYKEHRNKGVMNGARSLIALFREINPGMLKSRDRGKLATMGYNQDGTARDEEVSKSRLVYGAAPVSQRVDGIELLEEARREFGEGESDIDNQDDDSDKASMPSDSDVEEEDDDEEKDSEWESVSGESDDGEDEDEDDDEVGDEDDTASVVSAAPSTASAATTATSASSKKSAPLEQIKVITPRDFELIQKLKAKRQAEALSGVSKRKRAATSTAASSAASEPAATSVVRDLNDIHRRENPNASTTNREKARNKNFMMIAHKQAVKVKSKRSFREKQRTQHEAKEKQRKMKH